MTMTPAESIAPAIYTLYTLAGKFSALEVASAVKEFLHGRVCLYAGGHLARRRGLSS
jgi:hypothetical protein